MNRTQILFLSGVLLLIGLINAYVLHMGFNMLREKSFSSSASSPSPAVAALPGNRFVIIDGGRANVYRMDGKGEITPESSSLHVYEDGLYRSFEPFPTPIPTATPYINR